jgi:hypothetical protein
VQFALQVALSLYSIIMMAPQVQQQPFLRLRANKPTSVCTSVSQLRHPDANAAHIVRPDVSLAYGHEQLRMELSKVDATGYGVEVRQRVPVRAPYMAYSVPLCG